VGLLKKGLSVFRQRGGQNDAGGSIATAAVTDGRFCVKSQVGSKTEFFNSPTVSNSPQFLYCVTCTAQLSSPPVQADQCPGEPV